MQFEWSERFTRDYRRLSTEDQEKIDGALRRFSSNPRHPGLHLKKMKGTESIWEIRASDNHRITFQFDINVILRRVGTHDVLRNP